MIDGSVLLPIDAPDHLATIALVSLKNLADSNSIDMLFPHSSYLAFLYASAKDPKH